MKWINHRASRQIIDEIGSQLNQLILKISVVTLQLIFT